MNCKSGDMAYIVGSQAGNDGKIVRCVKFIGEGPIFTDNGHMMNTAHNDWWKIEPPIDTIDYLSELSPKDCHYIPDSRLRPLRGDLLDDETVTDKELETT